MRPVGSDTTEKNDAWVYSKFASHIHFEHLDLREEVEATSIQGKSINNLTILPHLRGRVRVANDRKLPFNKLLATRNRNFDGCTPHWQNSFNTPATASWTTSSMTLEWRPNTITGCSVLSIFFANINRKFPRRHSIAKNAGTIQDVN